MDAAYFDISVSVPPSQILEIFMSIPQVLSKNFLAVFGLACALGFLIKNPLKKTMSSTLIKHIVRSINIK